MIIYKDVEVAIDLEDFTTEDLVEELESRDVLSSRDRSNELLTHLHRPKPNRDLSKC